MILVPILLAVTAGFAAFAVYIDVSVHSDLIDGVDNELSRAQRNGFVTRPPGGGAGTGGDGGGGGGGGPIAVPTASESADGNAPPVQLLLSTDGELLLSGDLVPFNAAQLATIATLTDGVHTVDEPSYRLRTTRLPDGIVTVTGLSLSEVDSTVDSLRQSLFGGAIVVVALQALAVWFIAAFVTRPIARMATAARRVASGELDTEIGEPSGSSETVGLALDLDLMLLQLRSTLEATERSATEATTARNDMQQFLADASHELRTPLTAVKGYSDLYRGKMLAKPEDLDRAMGRIGSESERMARLVNDMLVLARQGIVDQAFEDAVDVRTVVANVVDDLGAARPECTIEADLVPDAPVQVLGDSDQLHQAILNIGSNACRHAPPNTPVSLEVVRNDDKAEVRIIDHGLGIAPEHVDQIFLPFYRIDDSRNRDDGGAGLGLAVTKKIVEQHDGTIVATETPGGGATFVITLPLGRTHR